MVKIQCCLKWIFFRFEKKLHFLFIIAQYNVKRAWIILVSSKVQLFFFAIFFKQLWAKLGVILVTLVVILAKQVFISQHYFCPSKTGCYPSKTLFIFWSSSESWSHKTAGLSAWQFAEQRYCMSGIRYRPQKSTNLTCSTRDSK